MGVEPKSSVDPRFALLLNPLVRATVLPPRVHERQSLQVQIPGSAVREWTCPGENRTTSFLVETVNTVDTGQPVKVSTLRPSALVVVASAVFNRSHEQAHAAMARGDFGSLSSASGQLFQTVELIEGLAGEDGTFLVFESGQVFLSRETYDPWRQAAQRLRDLFQVLIAALRARIRAVLYTQRPRPSAIPITQSDFYQPHNNLPPRTRNHDLRPVDTWSCCRAA